MAGVFAFRGREGRGGGSFRAATGETRQARTCMRAQIFRGREAAKTDFGRRLRRARGRRGARMDLYVRARAGAVAPRHRACVDHERGRSGGAGGLGASNVAAHPRPVTGGRTRAWARWLLPSMGEMSGTRERVTPGGAVLGRS